MLLGLILAFLYLPAGQNGAWAASSTQPDGAARADAHLQLFGSVDRSVVAVGTSFVLEIAAYATPGTPEVVEAVRRAFEAGSVAASEDLVLIRTEPATSRLEVPGEGSVVQVLHRRYIFRARDAGVLRVPAFSMRFNGHDFASQPNQITAFIATPSFFEASASIFPVAAEWTSPRKRRYVRTGSAFLIAPNAVVTSYHVIMDARRVRITLPGGHRITTRNAWVLDPTRDIAILHVDPDAVAASGAQPLSLAATDEEVSPRPHDLDNETVFTYGWPGGVQTSTAGRRFEARLHPEADLWISANPVRPGDSGGPLLDRHGQVLGVITSGTIGQQGLNEEVSVAAPLRPALARLHLAERPRKLSRLMRAAQQPATPHVEALRVTNMLAAGRYEPSAFKAAMERFDAALMQEPAHAQLYFLRGMIYQVTGQSRRAQASYQAALEAFGDHFLAANMLGTYRLQHRDYRSAEQLFRYTAQSQPYARHADYGLARALIGRLRYAEAVPHLQAVLAYDSDFAPAYYDLARCYLALGDSVRAHQLQIPLKHLDPYWTTRLRQMLRLQVLRPVTLQPLPRAPLPLL